MAHLRFSLEGRDQASTLKSLALTIKVSELFRICCLLRTRIFLTKNASPVQTSQRMNPTSLHRTCVTVTAAQHINFIFPRNRDSGTPERSRLQGSGAERGSLHGGASLKGEEAHLLEEGKRPHPQDKSQYLDFTKDPRLLYYKTPPCVFYHKNVRSKAVFGP